MAKQKKKKNIEEATPSVHVAADLDVKAVVTEVVAAAPHLGAENIIELHASDAQASSNLKVATFNEKADVTTFGKDKVAENGKSSSSDLPLLEVRSKCTNIKVLDAMKLKSGKLVSSSINTSTKLKQSADAMVAVTSATLSELLDVEKQSDLASLNTLVKNIDSPLLVESVSTPNESALLVESVRTPNVQISASVEGGPGVGVGLSSSALTPVTDGVSSTLGHLCGSEKGTPKGLEVDPDHPTNLQSEGASHLVAPPILAHASGVGVDHVAILVGQSSVGVTDTLGQDCTLEQGTHAEVDPVAIETVQNSEADQSKKDFAGQNAAAAVEHLASWVDMVKKNRTSTNEVISLIDCVEGITEDAVFIEEDDIASDNFEKFCLIGIFPSKFPGRDAVQKIVNSWPKRCRFNFHNSGWIVFVFEQEADLMEVLQAGPFFAFGKQMILKKMPHLFDFSKDECTTVPVWIQFPNLPLNLWNTKSLSKICSFVGSPQHSDVVTAKRQVLSFARCLVEVDLKMELPNFVPLKLPNGKTLMQPILYEEMPKFCTKCEKLGHNVQGHDDAKASSVPSLYVPKFKKPDQKKNGRKKKVVVVNADAHGVEATMVGGDSVAANTANDNGKSVAFEKDSGTNGDPKNTGVTAQTRSVTASAANTSAPVVNTFSVLTPISGKNWADTAEQEAEETRSAAGASGSKKSKKKKKGNKHNTDYVLDMVDKPDHLVSRGKAPLQS